MRIGEGLSLGVQLVLQQRNRLPNHLSCKSCMSTRVEATATTTIHDAVTSYLSATPVKLLAALRRFRLYSPKLAPREKTASGAAVSTTIGAAPGIALCDDPEVVIQAPRPWLWGWSRGGPEKRYGGWATRVATPVWLDLGRYKQFLRVAGRAVNIVVRLLVGPSG